MSAFDEIIRRETGYSEGGYNDGIHGVPSENG